MKIEEVKLTAKALRRDAIDYRDRLFAIGTDKTMETAADIIDSLVDALEKHIPKKPKIYYKLNETTCPECGYVFGYAGDEYDGETYNYCPDCGQRLKW